MALGYQPTQDSLNQTLGNNAVATRDICRHNADLFAYVSKAGTAGLEALGFSAAEAAEFSTQASYLNTIAGIFEGTATQATQFDFADATSGLTAGQ